MTSLTTDSYADSMVTSRTGEDHSDQFVVDLTCTESTGGDDAVSVTSTSCSSSAEGGDQQQQPHQQDVSLSMSVNHTPPSQTKRAIWKDKGGRARYTLRDDNLKPVDDEHDKPKRTARQAVAAAAVTAGVVTGGVVGLVVLGPVGLVVGGMGGVGSAASALVTQRRMAFQRQQQQQQQQQAEQQQQQPPSTPLAEPPSRSF